MSKQAGPAKLDATDQLAIAHLADVITEVTGNTDYDTVATQVTALYADNDSAAYAALCYACESIPLADLMGIVTRALA